MFGVEYELDLMPYWTKHYLDMKLDSYRIFLHKESGSIDPSLVRKFESLGFFVQCLDGPHSNGILRNLAITDYASHLPKDDFLVTADADEFQIQDYRFLLGKYDFVTGYLVDRYAGSLEECHKNPFIQYQWQEPFTKEVLKNFSPPYLRNTDWPYTRRNKILAARVGYETSFMGSHCMKYVPSNAVELKDQMVYHFAWRAASRRKLAVKSYFKTENLSEMFGGEVPPDCIGQLSRLRELDTMEVL